MWYIKPIPYFGIPTDVLYEGIEFQPHPKQELLLQATEDVVGFGGAAGGGKAMELNTPILTANRGWTTFNDIRVGDQVYGGDGHPTDVVWVSPVMQNPSYRITLHTGTSVIADAGHLWQVSSLASRQQAHKLTDVFRKRRRATRPKRGTGKRHDLAITNAKRKHTHLEPKEWLIRTTKEIAETCRHKGRVNYHIQRTPGLHNNEAELPIPPYLLGLWLGDGSSYSGEFTSMDDELWDAWEQSSYGLPPRFTQPSKAKSGSIPGLRKDLTKVGVLENKHIPDIYMQSSFQQRLELLRGIMDTDGYLKKSAAGILMKDCHLMDDVVALARSLGNICNPHPKQVKVLNKIHHAVRLTIALPDNPFRLQRKADVYKAPTRSQNWRITDVQDVGMQSVRCITVENPDGMFLCSKELIPTHNSDGILFKAVMRAESEAGTDIVAFRKTNADAIKPKAIWPRLLQMTAPAGWASRNQPPYSVTHPYNSSRITIGHLQKPTTYLDWQGSGIDMFMFDELTHFTAEEFHYLRSRLAREEGRQSQVVFTCNPDPQSWVKQLLAPWVDDQHEWYPLDPDVVLYVETGETPEEVTHHKEPGKGRFSLRFIPSKLEDNPSIGAEYEKQLESLPKIFRDALLEGDWNLVVKAGAYFNIHVLPIGPRSDSPIVRTVRFWDTAGGQKQSGDYMVGCKMSRQKDGNIFIQDVWRERVSAGRIEQIILDVADRDGKHVLVGLEQEGASEAGAFVIGVRRKLQKKGIRSVSMRPRTDKGKRAQPFAAAAEQGLVSVADEPWRRAFVNELVLFPDGAHDDQFDAGAGGYILVARKQGDYSYWSSSSGGVQ